MAPSFTIAGVVTEGLDRALVRMHSLLAIYWLPWLIGSIVMVILRILWAEAWPLAQAPAWALNLVWGPCIAMAYVMAVRLLIFGRPPRRAINLDFSRETAWAALVVTVWFLATVAVKSAPAWTFQLLLSPYSAGRAEALMPFFVLSDKIARIISMLLNLCFFGLIVLTVRRGFPDLREHIRLLRAHPLRLFAIAFLASAAAQGLITADAAFRKWAGVLSYAPQVLSWRHYIREEALYGLSEFPLYFLLFVTETCLLAEAYRRLLRVGEARTLPQPHPIIDG